MHQEKIQFAMAMRLGRAALGLGQQAFADKLGVATSTIARNETLDMSLRADTLMNMLRVLNEHGVDIDVLGASTHLTITIREEALNALAQRFNIEVTPTLGRSESPRERAPSGVERR